LGSATLGDASTVKTGYHLTLGMLLRIAIGAVGKEDDPPRDSNSHVGPFTEDRQDDAQADCGVGKEADDVSHVVQRLFWATRSTGVVASLCQRTTIEFVSQDGRGNRLEMEDRATDITTLSRIDQVG
jgi:hypothetical protein